MASNKKTGFALSDSAPGSPAAVSSVKRKTPGVIVWPDGLKDDAVLPIEELREKLNIKTSLFAGVCTANRWRPGKQISVKEFKAAAEKFAGGAMGRGEKRCSGT